MSRRTARAYAVRADDTGAIVWMASRPEIARDGLEIPTEAWDLTNFRKNSPLMWAHDYSKPPIGKVTKIEPTKEGLIAETIFDTDPFSAEIERKVRAGFISACSVGFDIKEITGNRVSKAELLELSVVPVGSDPGALAMARTAYRSLSASGGPMSEEDMLREIRDHLIAGERKLREEFVLRPLVLRVMKEELLKAVGR